MGINRFCRTCWLALSEWKDKSLLRVVTVQGEALRCSVQRTCRRTNARPRYRHVDSGVANVFICCTCSCGNCAISSTFWTSFTSSEDCDRLLIEAVGTFPVSGPWGLPFCHRQLPAHVAGRERKTAEHWISNKSGSEFFFANKSRDVSAVCKFVSCSCSLAAFRLGSGLPCVVLNFIRSIPRCR